MSAIQPSMMTALKSILEERFVALLPNLNGPQKGMPAQDKQVSRAFNAFILQKLFDLSSQEAAQCVVDEVNDYGIDAFYYRKLDETLYLVQGKLKASEAFSQEEAQSFTRGIRLLVEQKLDNFNQLFKDREQELAFALDHCSHIQLVIAYTGSGVTRPASNALNELVNDHNLAEERFKPKIKYVSAVEIEEFLRAEQRVKTVDTCLKLRYAQTINDGRITAFGLVNVDDLVGLHEEHKKALYQKNIRYFIGTNKRGVNTAIRDTLKTRPNDFLYLNNGVTAVCTEIKPKSSKQGIKKYDLSGFSIINGAQTISSAAQFKQENPNVDTSAACVMITLIKASNNGGFHKEVTKARNLQNPVALADFAALDDTQERLRQEIALHGYEYRYRHEAAAANDEFTIEINELVKALACLEIDIRYPAKLKSEPDVFVQYDSDEYKAIFSQELDAYKAINSVTVYRVIRELLRTTEKTSNGPEKAIIKHGVYAIACVLMKRLKKKITGKKLIDPNALRQDISAPLDILRQQCIDSYDSTSQPHAFFKRLSDSAQFINHIKIMHEGLKDDDSVQNLLHRLEQDDPYNQRLNNYLSGKLTQI